jgi:hypothetical protein
LTRSRSEKALDRLRVPSTGIDKEGRILPDSLEKTLHIHRVSNRASLLRKVAYDKPSPDVFRPLLSKKSPEAKQQEGMNQKEHQSSAAEPTSNEQTTSSEDQKTKQLSSQNDVAHDTQKLESRKDGQSRDIGQGTS